jgi:hypothetical protein
MGVAGLAPGGPADRGGEQVRSPWPQLVAIAAPASSQDGKMSSTAPQYACSPVEEFDMLSERRPVRAGTRSGAAVESVVTADLFPQS